MEGPKTDISPSTTGLGGKAAVVPLHSDAVVFREFKCVYPAMLHSGINAEFCNGTVVKVAAAMRLQMSRR